MYYGSGTVDRSASGQLSDAICSLCYTYAAGMLSVHSPDSSTSLLMNNRELDIYTHCAQANSAFHPSKVG